VHKYLSEAVKNLKPGTNAYADAVEESLEDITDRIVKLHEGGGDINIDFLW
jgi:hypothetical protein